MKFLFLVVVVALAALASADVLELSKESFNEKTTSGNTFVKFFAPWCGHCQRLAPAWKDLSSQVSGNVNIASVDCTQHGDLCTEYNIRGYPTLVLFKNGRSEKKDYNGARDIGSLKSFLQNEGAL